MSILTFGTKRGHNQWRFKLRRAKYRFPEAGLSMLIGRIPNITLRVRIDVYEQTGEETGQGEDLVRFCAMNSTGTGKVREPL